MNPDIRWITAVYGVPETRDEKRSHIAVPDNARSKLHEMAAELVGTSKLVALYVPEGTEDVYKAGDKCGRVIGLVQLVEMPKGKTIEDFFYNDWGGTRRWPVGWPCHVVCNPPPVECPQLREHVESLIGEKVFGGYVKRFKIGPFRLEPEMRARLNRDFAAFCKVD